MCKMYYTHFEMTSSLKFSAHIIAPVLSFACQRRLAESSELILAGCALLAVLCCWCMWEQSSSLCACARCDYFWLWLKTGYLALRYRQWIMLSSLFFLLLLVVETNTLHATFCRTHLRITRVSHRIMQHSLRPAVARPALHPQPPHPPVRFPAQLQKQSSAIMTESRVPGVAKSPKWSSRGLASRKIWTFLTQSIVTWFKYS